MLFQQNALPGDRAMSRIDDLIRAKQTDIERLKREIAALKIAAPLLSDDFVATRPQDGVSSISLTEIQ
jgi:hypothetical protein